MNRYLQAGIGLFSGAAIGAATGAINGSLGAAVLAKAGYQGYSALTALRIISAGNAFWGALIGGFNGFYYNKTDEKITSASCLNNMLKYVAHVTIGGMIGYGATCALNNPAMRIGSVAAASAIGGVVTVASLPVIFGLCSLFKFCLQQPAHEEISQSNENTIAYNLFGAYLHRRQQELGAPLLSHVIIDNQRTP